MSEQVFAQVGRLYIDSQLAIAEMARRLGEAQAQRDQALRERDEALRLLASRGGRDDAQAA